MMEAFMNLFQKFILWMTGTKPWIWLVKNFMARFNIRILGNPKFPMEKWYEVEKLCLENQDKCLVFTCYGTKLTSWLIRLVAGSKWTHAGVVIVVNGVVRVIHMESKGLLNQVLLELLREVDDFALILVPLSPEEVEKSEAVLNGFIAKNPKYDFQMLLNNKGVYCSELIYEMLKDTGKVKTHMEQGRKVFEPEDVYKIGTKIFEHKTKG
jgi:hypothetical protein